MPHPGPSLCGVLMAADSNVCANFQEFLSTLRPPKVPGRLKKKKKKKKIIILWKTIGPCALLAWALNIKEEFFFFRSEVKSHCMYELHFKMNPKIICILYVFSNKLLDLD